ncbi:unnamed protein product [Cladocopium goreaui]|uniref:EF-hand domain-containing protein n=1 Tax=Cladocopium goreaui TaxID=2562237 RepID=A0A9P1FI59_9DINO|nr:unnamed protein product [Cladocopium goreaui]
MSGVARLSSVRWWCRCEVLRSDLTEALRHLIFANLAQPGVAHPSKNLAKSFCDLLEATDIQGSPYLAEEHLGSKQHSGTNPMPLDEWEKSGWMAPFQG